MKVWELSEHYFLEEQKVLHQGDIYNANKVHRKLQNLPECLDKEERKHEEKYYINYVRRDYQALAGTEESNPAKTKHS